MNNEAMYWVVISQRATSSFVLLCTDATSRSLITDVTRIMQSELRRSINVVTAGEHILILQPEYIVSIHRTPVRDNVQERVAAAMETIAKTGADEAADGEEWKES